MGNLTVQTREGSPDPSLLKSRVLLSSRSQTPDEDINSVLPGFCEFFFNRKARFLYFH